MNIMQKTGLLFIGCFLLVIQSCSFDNSKNKEASVTNNSFHPHNPVPVAFGDPFILKEDDMYYMYGTGGGAKDGYAAYSSPDLQNWKLFQNLPQPFP